MSNNKVELNLVDKLVLLALDDEKGTFVSDAMVFGYCMAGAALFELSMRTHIHVAENKVKLTNKAPLGDDALDYCLELISSSSKERTIRYWIEKLGNRERELRKRVLDKLVALEILEQQENKVLWVFTTKKYPTKNELPENIVRKRLHDIVVNESKAEVDEIMIISLVNACKLNKEVYGKEIAKREDKKIKGLVKDYPFADTTGKLIKELHDTITAVLVMLITTTTITSTSST